jgi:hypothetical protein
VGGPVRRERNTTPERGTRGRRKSSHRVQNVSEWRKKESLKRGLLLFYGTVILATICQTTEKKRLRWSKQLGSS